MITFRRSQRRVRSKIIQPTPADLAALSRASLTKVATPDRIGLPTRQQTLIDFQVRVIVSPSITERILPHKYDLTSVIERILTHLYDSKKEVWESIRIVGSLADVNNLFVRATDFTSGGRIFVGWLDATNEQYRIAHSDNDGDTWTIPASITRDINELHETLVTRGTALMVFVRRGTGASASIYRYKWDSGWTGPIEVRASTAGLSRPLAARTRDHAAQSLLWKEGSTSGTVDLAWASLTDAGLGAVEFPFTDVTFTTQFGPWMLYYQEDNKPVALVRVDGEGRKKVRDPSTGWPGAHTTFDFTDLTLLDALMIGEGTSQEIWVPSVHANGDIRALKLRAGAPEFDFDYRRKEGGTWKQSAFDFGPGLTGPDITFFIDRDLSIMAPVDKTYGALATSGTTTYAMHFIRRVLKTT